MTPDHRLRSVTDVDDILDRSHAQPVLVFKHSATCGISAMAWEEWQAFLQGPESSGVYCAHLIVQDDRPVSNELAQRLDVRHESPQAILIVDGRAHWHTSHMAITRQRLAQAVASAPAPGGDNRGPAAG
nr:bacillithiol system redox-active protein YtxJ [Bacillota bacterium]